MKRISVLASQIKMGIVFVNEQHFVNEQDLEKKEQWKHFGSIREMKTK